MAAQRWLRAEAMAGWLLGFGAAALVGWDGFLGCGGAIYRAGDGAAVARARGKRRKGMTGGSHWSAG